MQFADDARRDLKLHLFHLRIQFWVLTADNRNRFTFLCIPHLSSISHASDSVEGAKTCSSGTTVLGGNASLDVNGFKHRWK